MVFVPALTFAFICDDAAQVSAGALEGLLDDDALDRLDTTLEDNKRERIAAVEEA